MARNSATFVTASYDETMRFWDFETGKCYHEIGLEIHNACFPRDSIYSLQAPATHINRLEVTPDKNFIAAASFPSIHLYPIDIIKNKPVMCYPEDNNVTALGFEKNGTWMYSGSEEGSVKVWDMRTNDCVKEFRTNAAINSVVLHPNQKELISADQNGSIHFWDLNANLYSFELVPEKDTAIRSLAISWDGSLLAAASDTGACYIWRFRSDINTAERFEPLDKIQAHGRYILKCLFSPAASTQSNSYLATAASDGTVKLWDINDFNLKKTLAGHERWVWDCAFTKDGTHLATVSSDGKARKWAAPTWQPVLAFEGHEKAVNCCALIE